MSDIAERIRRMVETRGISERALAKTGFDDPHGDVWALALALAAPLALLRRLKAEGDLTPGRLAAETGMPWWAAALRIDMTAVMV